MQIGKHNYETNPALTWGNYGGAGSVGLANLRYLQEEYPDFINLHHSQLQSELENPTDEEYPILIVAGYSGHDGQTAYLRTGKDVPLQRIDPEELLEDLENSLVLDEDSLYKVEAEWEAEAKEDYISEFQTDEIENLLCNFPGAVVNQILSSAWDQVIEKHDSPWISELSSSYICVDGLREEFQDLLKFWLDPYHVTSTLDVEVAVEEFTQAMSSYIEAVIKSLKLRDRCEFGNEKQIELVKEVRTLSSIQRSLERLEEAI